MKPRMHCIVVLLLFSLLICGGVNGARLSLDESDNGKTVSVFPGDSIVLTLPENPSTGFRWDLETTAGIVLVSGSYISPGTGRIGAAGTHLWHFMVRGTGTQEVSGIYRRPWVPVKGDENQFVLHLDSGKKIVPNPPDNPFFNKKIRMNTYFIPRLFTR